MGSTTYDGDEYSNLGGSDMDSSIPPWQDDRWWIRRLAKALRVITSLRESVRGSTAFRSRAYDLLTHSYFLLTGDYLNALLVFLPLGIIGGAVGWDANAVFALNSLALIPLPGLLSFATGDLLVYINKAAEGLLNVILVNLIPLIIGIISVTRGEIRIAQSFVIGSILSNTLLGLGGSFFLGGLRYHEQVFNSTLVGLMASLLVVIASLFVIFGALSSSLLPPSDDYPQDILMLSHATACMLLLLYILWFQFRFRTHTNLAEPWYSKEDNERCPNLPPRSRPAPSLTFFITLTTLSCAVICARYLIASVDAVVQSEHISRTFIGLVLLPTSTYTFNHIQTFAIACEDKMNLAVELTLGASVDVTFVILPVLILIGWVIRQPMSMQFQLLETILLGVSVFLTSSIVSNGKSNYLEGAMYLGIYTIIILTYAVYPGVAQGP